MMYGAAGCRRRRWAADAPATTLALIARAATIGLASVVFTLSSLGIPAPAYAGKGGVPGSNNAGGNGKGNGVGTGGGNSLGNAYGHDDPGGPSVLDLLSGNAKSEPELDGDTDDFVPPGQEGRDGDEITEALEAATKTDSGLHLGTLKDLNAIAESASDFLGTIDFPGKASPPGLTGEKTDPQGKAVGHQRTGQI